MRSLVVQGVRMKTRTCYPLAFAVSVVFSGCDSSQGSSPPGAESKGVVAAEQKGYVLTDREKSIIKVLLIDEIKLAAENGDGYPALVKKIVGDYVVTTSDKLQKAYEKNEVAGDQQFRNKPIFINGTVKSIDRSVGENYFISLKGGTNQFMQPKASMADGYTNFLASLEKGDRVFLFCKGNGMLMGSAIVAKCEPLIDYARKVATDFSGKLNIGNIAAKPDASNKAVLVLSIFSVATAAGLPDSSACFAPDGYGAKCLADIRGVSGSKNKAKEATFQSAMKSASEKMGVDFNATSPRLQ